MWSVLSSGLDFYQVTSALQVLDLGLPVMATTWLQL